MNNKLQNRKYSVSNTKKQKKKEEKDGGITHGANSYVRRVCMRAALESQGKEERRKKEKKKEYGRSVIYRIVFGARARTHLHPSLHKMQSLLRRVYPSFCTRSNLREIGCKGKTKKQS